MSSSSWMALPCRLAGHEDLEGRVVERRERVGASPVPRRCDRCTRGRTCPCLEQHVLLEVGVTERGRALVAHAVATHR